LQNSEDKQHLTTTFDFECGSAFFPFKTQLDPEGNLTIYHKFDDYYHGNSAESETYFFEFHGTYKVLEHMDNWVRIGIDLDRMKTNHWSDTVSVRNVNSKLEELQGNLNNLKLSEDQMHMLRYIY